MAERMVKTIKQQLSKNADPYEALLAYHSSPLECGYSPAELLMGRRLRTTVPITRAQLAPQQVSHRQIAARESHIKSRQAVNFNTRHRAADHPLSTGDHVFVPDKQVSGTISEKLSDRSYVVNTPAGTYRRNRSCINREPEESLSAGDTSPPATPLQLLPQPSAPELPLPWQPESITQPPQLPVSNPEARTTRSGRTVKTPVRFHY